MAQQGKSYEHFPFRAIYIIISNWFAFEMVKYSNYKPSPLISINCF